MSLSNITLSAAVRQNLLSLQGTADLLATTQGRLATGKKVNSALDNPTNFFTAAGLDARASDISNLLDSIGNGVQVLQAANTGITSLSEAGRYRQVDRQPGAAAAPRLFHQVAVDVDDGCRQRGQSGRRRPSSRQLTFSRSPRRRRVRHQHYLRRFRSHSIS